MMKGNVIQQGGIQKPGQNANWKLNKVNAEAFQTNKVKSALGHDLDSSPVNQSSKV